MKLFSKKQFICGLLILNGLYCNAQDLLQGNKNWYSTYLFCKLNKRFFLDDYLLVGFDTQGHKFSFVQNDLALNYKLTSKLTTFVGVANYIYKWQPTYNGVYDIPVSRIGTISFLRASVGFKYKSHFLKNFEMDQSLAFQSYYPSLEKYQSRIAYSNQISYARKKTPWSLSPFAQVGLYYYLNGIPSIYYDNDGQMSGYYSADGLHRMRLKFGLKMKPFKNHSNFGVILYYCVQKEFNFNKLGGHLLNTSRNLPISEKQTIVYPFNNYNIYGVQLNYIFGKSKKK